MSQPEWGSELGELAKPPKRRIPVWVWGCGAGCLLATIVTVLLLALGFNFFRKAVDQDEQWERLAQHLPVETRPPGVQIFGSPWRLEGTLIWGLMDQGHGLQGVVFQAPPGPQANETRSELFDSTKEVSVFGIGRHEVEAGEIEIQGRRLRCVRYKTVDDGQGSGGPLGPLMGQMQGANIALDLAPEGSAELLALSLTRGGSSARIEDAEVARFLSFFRIPGGTTAPGAPPLPEPAEEGR